MTITIRTAVRRFPRVGGSPNGEPWMAIVYTTRDADDDGPDTYETTFAGSQPEAVQHAYAMAARLDRDLVAEVYASSSRVQRCGACRDLSHMHTYAGDCRHRVETPGAETTTKRRQPVVIGPEMEPTA